MNLLLLSNVSKKQNEAKDNGEVRRKDVSSFGPLSPRRILRCRICPYPRKGKKAGEDFREQV